ncbi:MAG TPA: class I SAM-dependent methyltransferase [Thermoanaerobaculia bacterium]
MGEPAAASANDAALSAAGALAYDEAVLDPAAEAALAAAGWSDPALDRAIAAGDEMLAWAGWHRQGSRQQALVTYFLNGLSAARTVEAVLGWRFGAAGRPSVLDFASGWGRVTRFLVHGRPAGDLTVSDVDAAAVDFQRRRFAVGGFASTERAADLARGERFDAVVALSLFSHLPEPSFREWLARLTAMVAPGGVLALTVLGEAALLPGRAMPASGFHFEAMSESERLDRAAYGSAWVSERFVAAALAGLGRPGLVWRRFPRALWHLQDLVLVLPDGGAEPAACTLPDEPRGAVEGWRRRPTGEVDLAGWAAGAAGPARRVEVRLGGRLLAEEVPAAPRADVARLLGDSAAASGWQATLSRDEAARAREVLTVVAEGADGTRGVLLAATLAAADERFEHANALAALEAERRRQVEERDRKLIDLGWEAEVLRRRLAATQASRFWKLRNAWFAVKRALGLAPRE